jgi:SAM-dependent methyltransferase
VELCCPRCRADLTDAGGSEGELRCEQCEARYPVILGIPDLRVFADPYIDIEADRAKGRMLAERFNDRDFPGLVEFYYSVTSVVPPQHARQYTRGLVAGGARSEAALAEWEAGVESPPALKDVAFLDVGCGTGPLVIAASRRGYRAVGVDIAFRWLVVGKKRLALADAGVDVPLICACAEALPFPSQRFDRVAFESSLEVVRDQDQALAEAARVLRPRGRLFLATPNRFSLGPDPHAGLWAAGFFPRSWVDAYVRRLGGIPPKRRLLSASELRRLIRRHGFDDPRLFLPDIPRGQRAHFPWWANWIIGTYHLAKRLPITRQLLFAIGPLLFGVARKG